MKEVLKCYWEKYYKKNVIKFLCRLYKTVDKNTNTNTHTQTHIKICINVLRDARRKTGVIISCLPICFQTENRVCPIIISPSISHKSQTKRAIFFFSIVHTYILFLNQCFCYRCTEYNNKDIKRIKKMWTFNLR